MLKQSGQLQKVYNLLFLQTTGATLTRGITRTKPTVHPSFMKKKQLIADIRKLKLPKDKYVVLMGGTLCVHGLRDAGDIDILIDKSLEQNLLDLGFMCEELEKNGSICHRFSRGNIEIFDYFWNIGGFETYKTKFGNIDMLFGIPFVTMEHLMVIKSRFGREKDLRDIGLIKGYFAAQEGRILTQSYTRMTSFFTNVFGLFAQMKTPYLSTGFSRIG